MNLDSTELYAIHHIINLYGHVLDEHRWSDLDRVFTRDAVLDYSNLGLPVLKGIDAVRASFSQYPNPPQAHHATNIVISPGDDQVHAVSKGLMLLPNGALSSWVYRDRFRKQDDLWRISHRIGARVSQAGPGAVAAPPVARS
jgi:hypothetical protein